MVQKVCFSCSKWETENKGNWNQQLPLSPVPARVGGASLLCFLEAAFTDELFFVTPVMKGGKKVVFFFNESWLWFVPAQLWAIKLLRLCGNELYKGDKWGSEIRTSHCWIIPLLVHPSHACGRKLITSRLTLCFRFPLCRTKTSCPHSPKLQSWTGVNYWWRKAKPSPQWSASCPLLPVHSGQRRETLILVRTGAALPPSPFISHASGWWPAFHAAPLWLFGSFLSWNCLQEEPNKAMCCVYDIWDLCVFLNLEGNSSESNLNKCLSASVLKSVYPYTVFLSLTVMFIHSWATTSSSAWSADGVVCHFMLIYIIWCYKTPSHQKGQHLSLVYVLVLWKQSWYSSAFQSTWGPVVSPSTSLQRGSGV